jgi:defect in organelle trafficking protein DotC
MGVFDFIKLSILALFVFLLTACASSPPQYRVIGSMNNLCDVQNLHAVEVRGTKPMKATETEAIREIAMSTGAQAALAWRSQQINRVLCQNAANLDRIFNFNLMLLNHNVIPPVLVQGDDAYHQADNQTIRISDRTYQIISQARFTTTAPHWRTYLWMDYQKPEVPMASFLPKTSQEREIWQRYSEIGWNNGLDQANTIFLENLSRLKRDFIGMARYRYLLAQGMVTRPFVAKSDLGITSEDGILRVHDQILRITALPKWQKNTKKWKVFPILDDDYAQPPRAFAAQ